MPPQISLAEFNRIASGAYNAGEVDFTTGANGAAELVKVNNHVWRTSKNDVVLSAERILEVKEAFLNALEWGGVGRQEMKEIRARLGLPTELDLPSDAGQREGIVKARFSPLTRAQVRAILDDYAAGGRGFNLASHEAISDESWRAGQATANMSARAARARDKVNMAALALYDARDGAELDHGVADAMGLLSTTRSLADIDAEQAGRISGANAANERSMKHTALVTQFKDLFSAALKLLPANVRETAEFNLAGMPTKIVKDRDGSLSAVIGRSPLATTVALKMDAQEFVDRLVGRSMRDKDTLGGPIMKSLLGAVYDHDLEGVLTASDRTSLTRNFAALILESKSEDAFGQLVGGNYNTGLLVEMAERSLDGEDVGDTKAKLDAYHAKLVQDNAGLPDDIKAMLEKVADIPLEKPDSGELLVRAPMTGDIAKVVAAVPGPPGGPVPVVPRDIGGLAGIKDFVADLVFSDDTMVGDVVVNRPGETMRKALSDDKKLIALAEIVKNPALLDTAVAPQIADVVKKGMGKIIAILDASFKAANNGESLAEAAAKTDFLTRFSVFFKDSTKLPGADIAKFDNIIQSMANKGCEKLQAFVNTVFKVNVSSANDVGSVVAEPYKDMSPEEIKAQLDGKSLNDILDSASTSDVPGQVGFFRQVISSYFTSLGKADKRSAFAAAMKYAQTFDFPGLQGDALDSAKKAAVNRFTGAILKGTSPLLQKMMQGLPKEIMGEYADALDDMKSHLAPIPRKIVQAHLLNLITTANAKVQGREGKILSIEIEKSLGAASVGEAFLCKVKVVTGQKQKKEALKDEHGDYVIDQDTRGKVYVPVLDAQGNPVMEDTFEEKDVVVKIMRHDAEKRVKAEAEIFTAAANKIPGMAKTWEGQLEQYMTEFDFTNEAANVREGVRLYGIKNNDAHPLQAIAPHVDSMKLSPLFEPQRNVMVAEVAPGDTVDGFFKEKTRLIREAASSVFERDPATGRIKWADGPVDPKTGKPQKVPVFKANIPATSITNLQMWMAGNYSYLQHAASNILEATKAWFHEAILGSGKFHGDTHSGNLMVTNNTISFIDFGNLYTLESKRSDGVNERAELMRVIIGAAFRDKSIFLTGLEKLLSPSGRQALAANRAKAEAILDSVLDKSKGSFSFNIVYRLQAAVVELQKLGLELPPQINCFIQSMVRLSNTVTEMNTIMNQCKAMVEATKTLTMPARERDELDYVGQAFDVYATEDGKKMVPAAPGAKKMVPMYMKELLSERMGGPMKFGSKLFAPGGEYTVKVESRLAGAQDPVAEAQKMVDTLAGHGDREHNIQAEAILRPLEVGFAKFKEDIKAADTAEKRAAAIKEFSAVFATTEVGMLNAMQMAFMVVGEGDLEAPASFASAITKILVNNYDALGANLSGGEALTLGKDASNIAYNELGVGYWASFSPESVKKAIVADSGKMGGDNDYRVDIGV